jgi:hypothetical protein
VLTFWRARSRNCVSGIGERRAIGARIVETGHELPRSGISVVRERRNNRGPEALSTLFTRSTCRDHDGIANRIWELHPNVSILASCAGLILLCASCPTNSSAHLDGSLPDASAAPDGQLAGRDGHLKDPDPCPATPCEPRHVVTTGAELRALIGPTAFESQTYIGRTGSGCVAPTPEIEVHGTVILDISEIDLPDTCSAGCRQQAAIVLRSPNGTCVPGTEILPGKCKAVEITDSVIRLLPYREATVTYAVPKIELIGPCSSITCLATQRLCEATQVCWNDTGGDAPHTIYRDHCKYCLGLAHQRCACWGGTGPVAPGTDCYLFNTEDTGWWGSCVDDICTVPP